MDDGLQLIIRAWAGLPQHLQRRMLDIVRGLDSGRSCPKCGQGPTVVRTSHQKRSVQTRRLQCRACGHKFAQTIPRALIAARNRQKVVSYTCSAPSAAPRRLQ